MLFIIFYDRHWDSPHWNLFSDSPHTTAWCIKLISKLWEFHKWMFSLAICEKRNTCTWALSHFQKKFAIIWHCAVATVKVFMVVYHWNVWRWKVRHYKMSYSDIYSNDPKFSDRYAWANSADPDQTSPVWSGSTLFAILSASFGLNNLW